MPGWLKPPAALASSANRRCRGPAEHDVRPGNFECDIALDFQVESAEHCTIAADAQQGQQTKLTKPLRQIERPLVM